HWVRMQFGLSDWKARRWIAAAHSLEALPQVSEAFSRGDLGIDKTVELSRFATAETEHWLLRWARNVTGAAIRRRADAATRSIDEAREAERARSVTWSYFDENTRFGLTAELSAAEGTIVARAHEHLAQRVPVLPGEEDSACVDARRADALVALACGTFGGDGGGDVAAVIVHAQLDGLLAGSG